MQVKLQLLIPFLGSFAKLQNAPIGFITCVGPSFRMKNSDPTKRTFMKFYIWEFFENWWKNTFIKQGVLYMKTCVHLWPYLTQFSLEYKMCQTKFVNKIKTHAPCFFFLFGNHTIYGIIWKTVLEMDMAHKTWRMRTAWWTPKVTDTHSQYVKLLLCHYNNGCTKAPLSYGYVHCLPS
jgi:hypothetical protein